MSNQIPVVVAGAGITGLSAALHLADMGAGHVLVARGPGDPSSARAPGMITGGQRDNFTRVAIAHQTDFARTMWDFGDRAFDRTVAWARSHDVNAATGRRLRLVVTPEELREATEAVKMMTSAGVTARLIQGNELKSSPWGACLGSRVIAIQDEGDRGGWIDAGMMHLRMLETAQKHPSISFTELSVDDVEGYANEDLVVTIGNKRHAAAALIVACHLSTGDIVPSLKAALVSSADQWLTASGPLDPGNRLSAWNRSGIAWSALHNHEWGSTLPRGRLLMGGGRVLRKWAGFEATEANVEERITNYIVDQATKTFAHWNQPDTSSLRAQAGLDCHPCDELPVIGPMYGEGRILVAAGFMGQGVTLGFQAGYCLAKLLMTGACQELPRRLWPERLRSLTDKE